LSYRTVRREPVVAVLSDRHPLATAGTIDLAALADEFLLFPRDVAPRLHDFYASLCRRAGFEPKQGRDSPRTRWTLGTWDATTAAPLPASAALELPPGVAALETATPRDELEPQLVWRTDDRNVTLRVFIGVAADVWTTAGTPPATRAPATTPARHR